MQLRSAGKRDHPATLTVCVLCCRGGRTGKNPEQFLAACTKGMRDIRVGNGSARSTFLLAVTRKRRAELPAALTHPSQIMSSTAYTKWAQNRQIFRNLKILGGDNSRQEDGGHLLEFTRIIHLLLAPRAQRQERSGIRGYFPRQSEHAQPVD